MLQSRRCITLAALGLLSLLATGGRAELAALEKTFDAPPDAARPMVRWWWYGPAVVDSELEKDMNFMKQGGFGGFEVQVTYPLDVDGAAPGFKNEKFLSPEMLAHYGFVAKKAKELGLRMDLTLGSGWPYGGPMFPITEAAGTLRRAGTMVSTGTTTVALPELREGETIVSAYVADAAAKYSMLEKNAAGEYALPAGVTGPTEVSFAIASHTGMLVKRPAFGAEGYVFDHFSPAALTKFFKEMADFQMAAMGGIAPFAIFCDSLEMAGESWSDNVLEEFQKRRGYDLKPLLPALFTNVGPETAEIRRDWGQTIVEVFTDNFIAPLQKWAHDHGTLLKMQAYGSPGNALSAYKSIDLPEGEGPEWRTLSRSRWGASAGHLSGKKMVSSETWTWLHSPVFRATPLDMKVEADMHFLSGITQLCGHGWPNTAPHVEYPGWRFYAAAVFNEKNPWFIVMPDVTKYVTRSSAMLREGAPAVDVLIYVSNGDAWANFAPNSVDMREKQSQQVGPFGPRLIAAGYQWDVCDDGFMADAKVVGNALEFPGGARYRSVLVPGVERMAPETLAKLEEFAAAGGVVVAVGRTPLQPGGLKTAEADKLAMAQKAEALFKGAGAKGLFVDTPENLIAELGKRLAPDVAFADRAGDFGYVHRKAGEDEIYFVVNTSNTPVAADATFRVAGLRPEIWNPVTGTRNGAKVAASNDKGMTLPLELPAYGSAFVVFSNRTEMLPALAAIATAPSGAENPAIDISQDWSVKFGADGNPVRMANLASWTEVADKQNFSGVATYEKTLDVPAGFLDGSKRIEIDFGKVEAQEAEAGRGGGGRQGAGRQGQPGGRGARAGRGGGRGGRGGAGGQGFSASVPEAAGAFAGFGGERGGGGGNAGRPTARVNTPIREAAVVYINGERAGSVWAPPFNLDVTGKLKGGQNTIRVDVGNTAINYMAGKELPDYTKLREVYGNRFDPQDMQGTRTPLESGLLGPIYLNAR